jgi:hypothetical protein
MSEKNLISDPMEFQKNLKDAFIKMGEDFGKAVGDFYKELRKAEISEGVAEEITKMYAETVTGLFKLHRV